MRGDICPICCGTEREQTVHCPLDCEYLQEARRHEQPPIADPDTFPNKDIRVTEQFLRDKEPLLLLITIALLEAALATPGAVDSDVKETLDALVRTYRTRQSGLYYDSRPSNPVANAIYARVQDRIEDIRKREREASGLQTIRDVDILGLCAFLQRMEIQQNNGRRLGRAFIDFMRAHFPQSQPKQPAPSLII
ncbi:MAG TPA: hypothetical protein VFA28_10705 [Bryobacteraceae bacterium]|nr:hypothetical protein [Bryobacteraceae bacterium]